MMERRLHNKTGANMRLSLVTLALLASISSAGAQGMNGMPYSGAYVVQPQTWAQTPQLAPPQPPSYTVVQPGRMPMTVMPSYGPTYQPDPCATRLYGCRR